MRDSEESLFNRSMIGEHIQQCIAERQLVSTQEPLHSSDRTGVDMDLQPSIGHISGPIEHSSGGSLIMLLAILALYFGFLGILFYFSLQIAGLIKTAAAWFQSRSRLDGQSELVEPPPTS